LRKSDGLFDKGAINMTERAWQAIFDTYQIHEHDFAKAPFLITANDIKEATKHFPKISEREPRILTKQDSREQRPLIFQDLGLFILPTKNGEYIILSGEGYVDIPAITQAAETYISELDFQLLTSQGGDSEIQHLDFAYANGLIHSILNDETLILTIRGRNYTSGFSFYMGEHEINVAGVRIDMDTVYEGINQVILIRVINPAVQNLALFRLYYPYRLLRAYTSKPIKIIFFEKFVDEFGMWIGDFSEPQSIEDFQISGLGRWQLSR
jgi:hypothetical protein